MRKIKILYICHGNICRSPMAEFITKDIVERVGKSRSFEIASAATSREEIGNPIYPPARRKLDEHGVKYDHRAARQITADDYHYYDYIVAMDQNNLNNLKKVVGDDVDNKITLLMSHAGKHSDVSDPWYTGDFETAYNDIREGCNAFIEKLIKTISER